MPTPSEPRRWMRNHKVFGDPWAEEEPEWRPVSTRAEETSRRAAHVQHLVAMAFRLEVQERARGADEAFAMRRLATIVGPSEKALWNILRGRSRMSLAHIEDMSVAISKPLLLVSQVVASRFPEDIEGKEAGYRLRAPNDQQKR